MVQSRLFAWTRLNGPEWENWNGREYTTLEDAVKEVNDAALRKPNEGDRLDDFRIMKYTVSAEIITLKREGIVVDQTIPYNLSVGKVDSN